MNKKIKAASIFNKNRIVSILSVVSFVGMILLWVYTIAFTQYVNERSVVNEQQITNQLIQSVQQQYCHDNAIIPCTQDAINSHAESTDTE